MFLYFYAFIHLYYYYFIYLRKNTFMRLHI